MENMAMKKAKTASMDEKLLPESGGRGCGDGGCSG